MNTFGGFLLLMILLCIVVLGSFGTYLLVVMMTQYAKSIKQSFWCKKCEEWKKRNE